MIAEMAPEQIESAVIFCVRLIIDGKENAVSAVQRKVFQCNF